MADAIISDLSPAAAVALTDKIELEQGATPSNSSKYGTIQQVLDVIQDNITPIVESVFALSIVAGATTINLNGGKNRNFTLTLTGNTTLAFSNLPSAGKVAEFELQFTQDPTGGRTVTLPGSMKALGNSDTSVAAAANSVTVLSAKTFDQGTTWCYAMQESA